MNKIIFQCEARGTVDSVVSSVITNEQNYFSVAKGVLYQIL